MLHGFNHLDNNDHRYLDYTIVEGGNAHLAEKLKEKIGSRISLGAPLKVITKTLRDSYKLSFGNGQVVEAEQVVLALPCSVYQDIPFEGDELLLSRLPDIKAVAYGEHAKLMVPICILQEMYGFYANDRFGTFSMATPDIITMYYLNRDVSFTPSTIREVFKRDRPFLELVYRDKFLSQRQPMYAHGEHFATYQDPVGYNWYEDPYSRGTYSCIEAGQEDVFKEITDYHGEKARSLFSPIHDRLFLQVNMRRC